MSTKDYKSRYYRPNGKGILTDSRFLTTGIGDGWLLGSALLLTAVGLVMVYSSSTFVAVKHDKVDWFFFIRQLKHTVIALLALGVGARFDVMIYKRFVRVLLLVMMVVMTLQLTTPLGPVIGGTRRWIDLGFINFQTSEAMRCLVVIYLARVIADEPDVLKKLDKRMLKVLGVVAVPMLLIFLQPDFSGALMMALTVGLVLFLGGLKLSHLFGFLTTGLAATFLMVMQKAYQRERLMNFIQRLTDGGGDNYQTLQSLIGFGRGGLFGVGLGQGKQKMLFLPEPHTDFIFSIIGEELGLVRTLIVLVLFLILTLRAFKVLREQSNRFSFLLGAGLAGSIIIYALVNMYVATGLLPVTGLPLPFISSGGTSMVVSLWSVGVLWNLSRTDEKSG